MSDWRSLLVVAAVLALAHLGLLLLPGPGFDPWTLLALYAAHVYASHAALQTLARRSGRSLALFAAGYAILFVLVLVLLERTSLFILLLVVYASVFGSTAVLGVFGLFVLSFVLLQPYAFETFIPLALAYVLLWRARRRGQGLAWGFLAAGLLALLLLLFPLIHLVMQDSPQTLWRSLARDDVQAALWTSVLSAGLSALLLALWGIPLAYALARLEFQGKRAIELLIDLPILVPQSVVGIALLVLLGPGAPLGRVLDERGLGVTGSFAGIVLAQCFVAAPFLIKTALTAFEGVPPRLELAARSLGASPLRTFLLISLPLASRGLWLGLALAFARAISEFGAVVLFASSPLSAPVLVHTEFLRAGISESRPVASLLLLTCLWIFIALQFGQGLLPFAWQRRGERAP
ncbi:MAG: ABC transporter permease [Pseudomonadota bacterium]